VDPEVMNPDYARVIETRDDTSLASQPTSKVFVGTPIKDFDGNKAFESCVAASINRARSSATEQAEDLITIVEGLADS
jgi:hypothetical protein